MTLARDVADRFVAEAFKPDDEQNFLRLHSSANVNVGFWNSRPTIYSYGNHFPMAHAMIDPNEREYWLVNGDTYSVTTNRHQAELRWAINANERRRGDTGLATRPVLIVPFSVLASAGLDKRTLVMFGGEDERTVVRTIVVPTEADVPKSRYGTETADGDWSYEVHDHFLGASVVSGQFSARLRDPATGESSWVESEARFVSAFDSQEPGRSYFFAQLPAWSEAETHAAALEDLKPDVVRKAEAIDVPVVRQGDVFAVETELSTSFLKRQPGAVYGRWGAKRPSVAAVSGGVVIADELTAVADRWQGSGRPIGAGGVRQFAAFWNTVAPAAPVTVEPVGSLLPDTDQQQRCSLHGTNHYATEVIVLEDGTTFARGTIRHRPEWRSADHVMQRLGKQWHEIVLNTVPHDDQGRPRAWQVSGSVD